MKKEMKSGEMESIATIEDKLGGKVVSVDCSYIVVRNKLWDNDLVLYIDGVDTDHGAWQHLYTWHII